MMADQQIEVQCDWVQISIPGRPGKLWAPRVVVDFPKASWKDTSGATVAQIALGAATAKAKSGVLTKAEADEIKADPTYTGKVTDVSITPVLADPVLDADPVLGMDGGGASDVVEGL